MCSARPLRPETAMSNAVLPYRLTPALMRHVARILSTRKPLSSKFPCRSDSLQDQLEAVLEALPRPLP